MSHCGKIRDVIQQNARVCLCGIFLMTVRNSVQNVSNNGAAHETSKDPRTLMRTMQVYFKLEGWGTPLQGGLEALRVLELVDCWGMLCIACSLPGLQVRKLPINFVYIQHLHEGL